MCSEHIFVISYWIKIKDEVSRDKKKFNFHPLYISSSFPTDRS